MSNIDFSKIYSYSKIELFDQCRKKYHFNYLDPEIAPIKKQFLKPRDYNTKGHAVHGAITLFYHLPVEKRTFVNLKECLAKAWFSELDVYRKPPLGKIGGFTDLNHEKKAYLESLRMLHNFFNIEDQNPSLFLVPMKEIKDSFDDYQKMIKPINGQTSISGKFDRIDKMENGNLRIVDFKTGRAKSGMFQLEFYKLLAELNFDIKVDEVSYYYLKEGNIKNFNVAENKTEQIKEKVLEKIDKIENSKDFSPNSSRLCDYCDFKEICPVFK